MEKKKKSTIKVYIFEFVKFSFNKQTWFFETNFKKQKKTKKKNPTENKKIEHRKLILHIRISRIKFQLKLKILIFLIKFSQYTKM